MAKDHSVIVFSWTILYVVYAFFSIKRIIITRRDYHDLYDILPESGRVVSAVFNRTLSVSGQKDPNEHRPLWGSA